MYPGYPKNFWCCPCSSGPVDNKDHRSLIGCEFCNTWAHKKCLGFSKFNEKKMKTIQFSCLKCHPYLMIFLFIDKDLNFVHFTSLRIIEDLFPVHIFPFNDTFKQERSISTPISVNSFLGCSSENGSLSSSSILNNFLHESSESLSFFLDINNEFKNDNDNLSELDHFIGEYVDSRVDDKYVRYICPIGSVFRNISCTRNLSSKFIGWKAISSLHAHIQEHCRQGQFKFVPSNYWEKYSRRFCKTCGISVSKSCKNHKLHFFLESCAGSDDEKKMSLEESFNDVKNEDEEKIIVLELKSNLPDWNEIWNTYMPTILSIPNSLIAEWCGIIEKLLNPLTTLKPNSTEDDWKKFFMVAKCLWFAPIRAGKKKRGANLKEFRRRIRLWKENKILELWLEFKECVENHEKAHVKRKLNKKENLFDPKDKDQLSRDQKYKVRRSQFYIRHGDVSGATNIMLSDGICKSSSSIKQQLIDKHPFEPEYDISYPESLVCQMNIQIDDVKKSIMKIKRAKAFGLDG